MMINRRTLLAATGLLLPAPVWGQAQPGPFRFQGPGGITVDAEWGGFEVPEDRTDPKSRRIRLNYVRFRSTAARPGYPLVYLAGGPGGAGTAAAMGPRFPIFQALREVGDVIAFDQRGTGASNHIPQRPRPSGPLPEFSREGLTRHFRTEFQAAWADWTAAGIAMRGYNTVENADDLEELRRHLAAEKIHLWGISYGTHLALAALKRHGERIGKVALASLEGLDQTVKRPAHVDSYFDRIDGLLASDRQARTRVPDLPGLMRRIHARLDAEPVTLSVPPAMGRPAMSFKIGGFALQMLAGGLCKNPDSIVYLPAIYLAIEAGRMDVVTPVLAQLGAVLGVTGMPEATDLASGVSAGRLVQIERERETSVLGDALNFPMPHLLGAIPGIDLGDEFRAPFTISNASLLIHGSLDGRTPLEEQADVVRQFSDRRVLNVENAGHDVLESHPGVQDALLRFFRDEPVRDQLLSLPKPAFKLG